MRTGRHGSGTLTRIVGHVPPDVAREFRELADRNLHSISQETALAIRERLEREASPTPPEEDRRA